MGRLNDTCWQQPLVHYRGRREHLIGNVSRIENVVARVATLNPFWGYEAKCHLQILMLCICNFV